MKVTVILPTYNPAEKLIKVVDGLINAGFDDIVLVDDGGKPEVQPVFDILGQYPCCTVLHHEVNRGKGRALKTGFKYFLENRPEQVGVITADDDGQHTPEDILRCARLMEEKKTSVFGVRDFKAAGIPWKSRFGNRITSGVFKFCCGIVLSDTQTGLRALPRECLPLLENINGERFEYETNMLLEMKQHEMGFIEEKISTIYEDGNKSTHFNPIKDSLKIYGVISKFLLSSLSCSIIDIVMFTLLNMLLCLFPDEAMRILTATVAARVISSLTNFFINQKKVFKSGAGVGHSLFKYYILSVIQLAASYGAVLGLTFAFDCYQSMWQSVIKIVVDTVLFFVSFVFQREWVFKSDKKEEIKR